MIHPTLYAIDNKGQVRTWYMETDGNGNHRTVAGTEGGKQVVSEWTACKAKNVGRSNATTAAEQAEAEVLALYKKKLKKKYYENREDASGGSRYFVPMLAEKWSDIKPKMIDDNGIPDPVMYVQPKLDGMRCIIHGDENMRSRNGEPILAAPHIFEELKPFFEKFPDARLDGELYNHEFKDDFDEIMRLVKKTKNINAITLAQAKKYVEYHIYDLPSNTGKFKERLDALKKLFEDGDLGGEGSMIKFVTTEEIYSKDEYDSVYGQWLEAGYEGIMLRSNKHYENRRTWSLIKRKEFQDAEFPVKRIEEGKGNWAGLAKRVIVELPDGRENEAGIRGNKEFARRLLHEKPWPKTTTIRFQNYTPDGKLRFPVAVAFYEGERND